MSETNKEPGGSGKRAWPLFVGLPLIVAVAIIAVLFSGGERSQPSQSAREDASRGDAELGHPTLGNADAPVVMIEYGDFQ